MSSLVTRKKAELGAKVQRLQERHDTLAASLDSSSGPAGQGSGGDGSGPVTEAEWKAKYEAVKAQLPAYKAMKKELAELEAEVGWGRAGLELRLGWVTACHCRPLVGDSPLPVSRLLGKACCSSSSRCMSHGTKAARTLIP